MSGVARPSNKSSVVSISGDLIIGRFGQLSYLLPPKIPMGPLSWMQSARTQASEELTMKRIGAFSVARESGSSSRVEREQGSPEELQHWRSEGQPVPYYLLLTTLALEFRPCFQRRAPGSTYTAARFSDEVSICTFMGAVSFTSRTNFGVYMVHKKQNHLDSLRNCPWLLELCESSANLNARALQMRASWQKLRRIHNEFLSVVAVENHRAFRKSICQPVV